MIATKPKTEADAEFIRGDCPVYAENPPFNAETLAAFKEAKDMAEGRIPVKWCTSIEEAYEELDFRPHGS